MASITVLFENDDLVVIDKPAGLLVHEDGIATGPTVVDWLIERVPSAQGIGEPGKGPKGTLLNRSGIVHRLDAETSGVMVLAKNELAFLHLKRQFHDRLAKKEYRAFVYGTVKERWGTIDRSIGRSAKDFRLRSAQRGAKGTLRAAVTDWELVKTGAYEGEPFSELRLMPKTGRTHQLRVHLKAVDHPIVFDALYAGKKLVQSSNLGLARLALHAHALTVTLPSGETETFVGPLPQEFLDAAHRIG